MRKADYFGDRFFRLGQGAKAGRIEVGVNLLDELERDEIENKGLLVQHNDHHVLSQLHVHNQLVCVERDLCPVLLLVVVPDDNFVPLLLINKNDDIRLVHHFDECNLLAQILNLLLQPRASRVILQNLETRLRRNRKVLLRLVGRYRVYLRLLVVLRGSLRCTAIILLFHRLLVRLLVLLHNHLVDDAVFRWHHVPLLVDTLLHVGPLIVCWCGLIRVTWLCA